MAEKPRMPLGDELLHVIREMGHNPNSFSKLVNVSQTAVLNWINNPKVHPKEQIEDRVLEVLKKRCRTCRQFTEKEDAWDNSPTERGKGGRQR